MTTPSDRPTGRARPLLRAVALGSALSGCVPETETPTEELSWVQKITRRASELVFGEPPPPLQPPPPPPERNYPGNPKGSRYNDPVELTPPVEPVVVPAPEPVRPVPFPDMAERPVYGNPKGSRYDIPPPVIAPVDPAPTHPTDPDPP